MIYPVSNLSRKKLGTLGGDGSLVQEFDSEITLRRKVFKAQAKFSGWDLGIRNHSRRAPRARLDASRDALEAGIRAESFRARARNAMPWKRCRPANERTGVSELAGRQGFELRYRGPELRGTRAGLRDFVSVRA